MDSDWNRRILLMMVTVSLAVAAKRFLMGLYLGRKTFHHFGGQLAKVMNKMVLIAEVAQLSKRLQKSSMMKESGRVMNKRMESIQNLSIHYDGDGDDDSVSTGNKNNGDAGMFVDYSRRNPLTGSLLPSEKMKLSQILERWEEPEREAAGNVSRWITVH